MTKGIITLKSVAAIRKLRPSPRIAAPVKVGYCVLGAWCQINDGDLRYPHADTFINTVAETLAIRFRAPTYDAMRRSAINILTANDKGHFEEAWGLLEQFEKKFLRGRKNVVLVDE